MNTLLLSAGLGTRLRPLTNEIPKALIAVADIPIIKRNLDKLASYNVKRVVINVHYLADKIMYYLSNLHYDNMEIIISDERSQLLDTGGALLKAKPLFLKNEPILIYNVDILSGTDFDKLMKYKEKNKIDALLVVQNRNNLRKLIFDKNDNLSGWINYDSLDKQLTNVNEKFTKEYSFSGISLISYDLLDDIPFDGVFSIITLFLYWAKRYKVSYYEDNDIYWFDIGTFDTLQQANEYFKKIDR
ncbi:MAG: nucleotidyltransferase family protein [Rikenellaceae bacterium MAG02]